MPEEGTVRPIGQLMLLRPHRLLLPHHTEQAAHLLLSTIIIPTILLFLNITYGAVNFFKYAEDIELLYMKLCISQKKFDRKKFIFKKVITKLYTKFCIQKSV